ncbi:MAG TPA: helix-turn-helix domain-containing protein [Candidatus Saccharimonadales bacterium]|nr:helix-turn-helix domain-containing protein [Candidatus Saccharimonadales bacterium]
MNKTELLWRERTSGLKLIASVWTCNASEVTARTVLADPCISIILVKGTGSAELLLRGPETKPRDEVLMPGYVWTAIRLQPGVQLKNFPAEQFTDDFLTLPVGQDDQFQFEGAVLKFPSFNKVEQLIRQMQSLGLISGNALDDRAFLRQGLSSKSYSRLVKRTTGLSPHKLRQLQRIHQALQLLKQGVPATVVATDLGFVDQAHLIRSAKQFFGHTPKELLDLPQRH